MFKLGIFVCLLWLANVCWCDAQYGPDPWNYEESTRLLKVPTDDVPPDLRISPRRKEIQSDNGVGMSEWFYKRILAIVMKGGKVEKMPDDSVEVTLQMHFTKERWLSLNQYLASADAFSEDIYRRSMGFVEEAIVKPTFTEKIIVAWMDYMLFYFGQYQMYITCILGFLGAALTFRYAWDHMSHRHLILFAFIAIYLYEAFVSFKEAEQQEYDKFISAVNTCRWRFWTSECHIPAPDPLVFIKHMHPMRIGMRLFTMLVSEPILALSSTVKTLIHGITDDLWYPLDKVVFSILVIFINVLLLVFLLMILCNFILRIPFSISFLAGLVNIGISGRNRTNTEPSHSNGLFVRGTEDRLTGANLEKLLNVCAQVAKQPVVARHERVTLSQSRSKGINRGLRKSSSTGRLAEMANDNYTVMLRGNNNDRQGKFGMGQAGGSGDHLR